MLRVAFTELPVSGEGRDDFLRRLRAVPVLAAEARTHLDDVAADYADLAIHNLNNADGVGHGHPYRPTPPAGWRASTSCSESWRTSPAARTSAMTHNILFIVRREIRRVRGWRRRFL